MFNFKHFLAGAMLLVAAIPVMTSANSDMAHRLGSTMEVRIADNGDVIVRGAEVTAVSDSVITARTDFGATELNWQVKLDGATKFIGKNGQTVDDDDIVVGHLVSFSGHLDSTSSLTVEAKVVKDWSINTGNKARITLSGVVENLDLNDEEFILDTDRLGDITVDADTAAAFEADGDTIALSGLEDGDRVIVIGSYDSSTKIMTAERITIGGVRDNDDHEVRGDNGKHLGFWKNFSLNNWMKAKR